MLQLIVINLYERFKKIINVSNKEYTFFDLPKFGNEYSNIKIYIILIFHTWLNKNVFILDQLPFSIRVLLESTVRNCDNFQVTENYVQNILKCKTNQTIEGGVEVVFKPARVILQVKIYLKIILLNLKSIKRVIHFIGFH